MEERESFVFYKGFRDAIKTLPKKYQLSAFDMILDYGFSGIIPEKESIEKAILISCKPQIDKSLKRYENCVTNGKKGGRPKKNQEINQEQNQEQNQEINQEITKEEPEQNPKEPNPNLNYNYNDNYNYNYNYNNNISCTELEKSSSMPTEPPTITLMLNDKTEYPLYNKDIEQWQELYPAVDILQQLRKMKGWLMSHPKQRKTKGGILKFINSWLAKEQDKGGYYYGTSTGYYTTNSKQHEETEPECDSDRWIREAREEAESRGETFVVEVPDCDF